MRACVAWREAPADSVVLRELVRVSSEVRDRRLYRELLAVAPDASRPAGVRVAAVDAVAPLLHPALYWFTSARGQSSTQRRCSAWGPFGSHEAVQEEGAEPMGPASRQAGVAELLRLADENVPAQLADAARTVAGCARALLDARPPKTW